MGVEVRMGMYREGRRDWRKRGSQMDASKVRNWLGWIN